MLLWLLETLKLQSLFHIIKDERSKLDDKPKQCIFLGCNHLDFGYKLWDLLNKKIIRSKDIVFDDKLVNLTKL